MVLKGKYQRRAPGMGGVREVLDNSGDGGSARSCGVGFG